ncbi:Kinase [Spironucleus salmonicida]|nr:Kinase [Spironucleus salmonicida]
MEQIILDSSVNIQQLMDMLATIQICPNVHMFQYRLHQNVLYIQQSFVPQTFLQKQHTIVSLKESVYLVLKALEVIISLQSLGLLFGGYSSNDFIITKDKVVKYKVNVTHVLMFLSNNFTSRTQQFPLEIYENKISLKSDVYSTGLILIQFLQIRKNNTCMVNNSLQALTKLIKIQDVQFVKILQLMLTTNTTIRYSIAEAVKQLNLIHVRPLKCNFCVMKQEQNYININDMLQTQGQEIQCVIGQGSFGDVYLVYDKGDNEIVVKIIRLNSQQAMNLYISEVNTLYQFRKCEHIIKLFTTDKITIQGELYAMIQQEYAKFGDLRYFLNKFKNKLQIEDFLKIILDITTGLAFIHKHKIVHRDIKPDNIFITEDFTAKIGDFGNNEIIMNGIEMRGSFSGTIGYIAPEVMNGSQISFGVDIWSLGIMIQDICEFSSMLQSNQVLQTLITQCLQENPDNRVTAEQIQEMLKDYQSHIIILDIEEVEQQFEDYDYEAVKPNFTFSDFDALALK